MSQGEGDAIDTEKIPDDKKECEEVHKDGEVKLISNAAEVGGEENSGKIIADSEVVGDENGSLVGVTHTAKDENGGEQEDSKSTAEVKTDDVLPPVDGSGKTNNTTTHVGGVHGRGTCGKW